MIDFLYLHRKWLIYLPLTLYWIALFIGTSLPAGASPEFGVSDKIKHFSAYMILTIFLSFALKFQSKHLALKKNFLLFAFLIAIFYGVADELHQVFIPGRDCEFFDWVADFGGALLGAFISAFIFKKFEHRLDTEKV